MNVIERKLSEQVKHPQALIDLLAVIGLRAELCRFQPEENSDRLIPAILVNASHQSIVISVPSIFDKLPTFSVWTDESFIFCDSLPELLSYVSSVD